MTRCFAAHMVFPVCCAPIPRGIIETEEDGSVIRLIRPQGQLSELARMEFHSGILCPLFAGIFPEYPDTRLPQLPPALQAYSRLLPPAGYGHRRTLEWMKAIQQQHPGMSLEQLIRLFTLESRQADHNTRSKATLEAGNRPGILLISGLDLIRMRLSPASRLKKLI
ncbi:MAG: hypothetical protein AB7D05_00380 [Mangrovibacterium sp.]